MIAGERDSVASRRERSGWTLWYCSLVGLVGLRWIHHDRVLQSSLCSCVASFETKSTLLTSFDIYPIYPNIYRPLWTPGLAVCLSVSLLCSPHRDSTLAPMCSRLLEVRLHDFLIARAGQGRAFPLLLDTDCRVFQCMYEAWTASGQPMDSHSLDSHKSSWLLSPDCSEEQPQWDSTLDATSAPRLRNRFTGEMPVVAHGNGHTGRWFLSAMYSEMLPSCKD